MKTDYRTRSATEADDVPQNATPFASPPEHGGLQNAITTATITTATMSLQLQQQQGFCGQKQCRR